MDDIGVYSGLKDVTFNVHLYDFSSFGLEIELDLYSSVAKFGECYILDMRQAKTQFGQIAHSDLYLLSHE